MDEEIDDSEEVEERPSKRASGPGRVGNYSVVEVAKLMSEFPLKSNWKEMKGSGLNTLMQKCAEHWGQVSPLDF